MSSHSCEPAIRGVWPLGAAVLRVTARGAPAFVAGVMVAALAVVASPAAAWAHPVRPAALARAASVAATSASADLYVDNASGAGCSDTGSGTQAQTFCTITAAAAVVQPGQTVIVEPGEYAPLTISVSGTASDPITFLAADTSDSLGGMASIGLASGQPAPGDAFVVSGANNVVISGFDVAGDQAILIENSSDITINGGAATGEGSGVAAIQVTGASSNVTISRVAITADHDVAVQVDQGVTGAVVTTNTIDVAGTGPGVLLTDAPGTDITSNTVITSCQTAVEVTGTSTGTSLENNIVETDGEPPAAQACADTTNAVAFSVSAASTPQTVANYNLMDPVSGGPLYVWGATSYTSLASFTAATGQGANDIAASPGLGGMEGALGVSFWFPISSSTAAVDSADANAPGELPTDQLGNPRADDPSVSDTGTGPGYYDRGAVELEGNLEYGESSAQPDPAAGPLDVTATALPMTSSWPTNGPIGTDEFRFSDGSLPVLTTPSTISHVFTTAGQYTVSITQSFNGYFWDDPDPVDSTFTSYINVVVGAAYTPLSPPENFLDTRYGIGHQGPVPAGGSITLSLPDIDGQVSTAGISALAANVTVTDPTATGNLTVTGGTEASNATSNINFSAGQTIANMVTIQPAGGAVTFHNNSKGTVQVLFAVDGYYSGSGSGFQPLSAVRVMDTRNKIGVTSGPLPPHGGVRLDLSSDLPAAATAVVLNLTATQPKAAGFVTAYPDGTSVFPTSNLNFIAGETVSNQVIVPVTDGAVDFYDSSAGTVQLIADLEGYYSTTAPNDFVPLGPVRIADTRSADSEVAGPVPAHGSVVVNADILGANSGDVLNVTVTQPKAAGFVTVYGYNDSRPATSNINFSAGQTVAGLVTIQDTVDSVTIYNDSAGSVQIIVDEQGLFINPALTG